MEQWYISDPHFHHDNIIKFCNRPFSNYKEMDEYLITQWNERVKETDHITCLGDVTLERGNRGGGQAQSLIKLVRSLNGHKRLLLGNHDHFPVQVYLDAGFEKIYATHRNEHNWLLSHFPIHGGSLGSVVANVHGHIHNNPSPPPHVFKGYKDKKEIIQPYINICVEETAYGPITVGEVETRIKNAIDKFKETPTWEKY